MKQIVPETGTSLMLPDTFEEATALSRMAEAYYGPDHPLLQFDPTEPQRDLQTVEREAPRLIDMIRISAMAPDRRTPTIPFDAITTAALLAAMKARSKQRTLDGRFEHGKFIKNESGAGERKLAALMLKGYSEDIIDMSEFDTNVLPEKIMDTEHLSAGVVSAAIRAHKVAVAESTDTGYILEDTQEFSVVGHK